MASSHFDARKFLSRGPYLLTGTPGHRRSQAVIDRSILGLRGCFAMRYVAATLAGRQSFIVTKPSRPAPTVVAANVEGKIEDPREKIHHVVRLYISPQIGKLSTNSHFTFRIFYLVAQKVRHHSPLSARYC
jgi:hypothetical protein